MASLFIKPTDPGKKNISTRFVAFLGRLYKPIIIWSLRKKPFILGGASVLLVFVFMLFSRMGGEFVPTLDEGDLVIQPVLKTGTSLTKTIETTTQIEKILLTFPEVEQVVSRIGAAEVPTDPMSMEESDVIVKLKPKSEWVTADNKDELTDAFKVALTDISGIDYEFTQPIEMRFNELITGVRADLAIKIFGEDLDVLYKTATTIADAIQNVEGASDISVEKVAGLPQMTVEYDRAKIAKYGLNIADLNDILTMGFAGKSAGTIFEGEKQFDLVVRFDEEHRKDLADIQKTSVKLPGGGTLPFSEFANIAYTKGPAKISRDNTKRRIVIGVNVRNRDLESVVKDVQEIINTQIQIPSGYLVEYGGQFENLRSARNRLMVAVPIALVLIFFLLYFAFNSLKEALMIYSAIPLSAVGGVLFLYMRDLPFSISAGVGFIALFGIAVLNGIVLIEQFKELKEDGVMNINKRIIIGTQLRLRPVLLTAAAAALGFLPMAISTNAGAEVQRPLATVVIGGLITATLLTLVVLPVLYAILDKEKGHTKKRIGLGKLGLLIVLVGFSMFSIAQSKELSLDQAIALTLKNNKQLQSAQNQIEIAKRSESMAFAIEKTDIYYNLDQNNIAPNNLPLNVWGVGQAIKLPSFYVSQKKVLKEQTALAQDNYNINVTVLKKEITKAYYTVDHWKQMVKNYDYLDSIYQNFLTAATKKYEVGESNNLELLLATAKQKEIRVRLNQSNLNYEKSILQLNKWIQSDTNYTILSNELETVALLPLDTTNNASLNYLNQTITVSEQQLKLNKQGMLPDLNLTVFQGSNQGASPNRYYGFQAGIAVPLFFGADKAKIQAGQTEVLMKQNDYMNHLTLLAANYQSLLLELAGYREGLDYYQNFGDELFKQTIENANKFYSAGEIDYLQFIALLEHANNIKLNYIQNHFFFNLTAIEANYILN
jgi:cobalt-zinc-cadmium resistance protein CzcA